MIYSVAFVFNMIQFMLIYWIPDQAGRTGSLQNHQVALIFSVAAIAYFVGSIFWGRVLKKGNARVSLLIGFVLVVSLILAVIFVTNFIALLVLFFLETFFASLIVNAFQTFARGETAHGKLADTVMRYNVAWSSGVGSGYVIASVALSSFGRLGFLTFVVLAGLYAIVFLLSYKPKVHEVHADGVTDTTLSPKAESYIFVIIGFLLITLANFTTKPVTSYLPKIMGEQNVSYLISGLSMAFIYYGICLGAFFTWLKKEWLYKWKPAFVILTIGVFLQAFLAYVPNQVIPLITLLLGVTYGFVFFSSVYYASNNSQSSKNVGINESLVGIGGVLSLVTSNYIISKTNYQWGIFFTPAIIAALLQFSVMFFFYKIRGAK